MLPLMYLHGMSTLDFAPVLSGFFGSAAGLSASVVTRLTRQWQDQARVFAESRLEERDYVYIWARWVRHEAPHDRVGWKDHLRPVAAGR